MTLWLTVIAYLLVAFHGFLIQGLPDQVSVWLVLFVGFGVSAAVTGPILLGGRSLARPRTERLFLALGLRGLFSLLHLLLAFIALRRLPLAEATVLVNTAILWTPLVSRIALKEPMPGRLWGPGLAGFLGVVLVLHPHLQSTLLGAIAALGSGLFVAFQTTATRRLGQLNVAPVYVMFSSALLGVAVTATPALWSDLNVIPKTGGELMLIGLLPCLAGLIVIHALGRQPAWFVSSLSGITPLAGGLLDWWFTDRLPTPGAFVGMALIIAACVLVARKASTGQPHGPDH